MAADSTPGSTDGTGSTDRTGSTDGTNGTGSTALADAKQALLDWGRRQQAGRLERDRIEPISRDALLPVTEQQRYLWFLHRLGPDVPAYNVPTVLRLRGSLDVGALHRALRALVGRHESLRTRFGEQRGLPYQIVDPVPAELPLPIADLTGLPAAERDARALALAHEQLRQPFDLERGPLLRCWLARLGAEEHLLLLTVHHIVTDGWSVGILINEWAVLYGANLDRANLDRANLDGTWIGPTWMGPTWMGQPCQRCRSSRSTSRPGSRTSLLPSRPAIRSTTGVRNWPEFRRWSSRPTGRVRRHRVGQARRSSVSCRPS